MKLVPAIVGVGLCCLALPSAKAQVVPPFFGPGANSFTPQIGIVSTGVVNDVQAVVSSDRKYVTLTMRPSSANLLALRDFTFQNGAVSGIVGQNPPGNGLGNPLNQTGTNRVGG
jgi:hypothetical protein